MTVTKQIEAKVDAGNGTPEEVEAVRTFRAKMAQAQERQNRQLAEAVKKMKPATFEGHGATPNETPEEILTGAGITVEDAADFLKRDIPQPCWIVHNFIAQHMKGDLCGASKTMKTFLAVQLGVCLADGTDFLNIYHVEKPHTVAYVNLELFDWNAQERLASMCEELNIDKEQLRGRLYILNMRANPAAHRGQSDLNICGQCPHKETCRGKVENLCKAARAEKILDAFSSVLKKHGVEIVIIDPRYKLIMPGEDENTGDGLRGVLALRDALARHFAVLIVTHDPKGDTSERKTTDRGAGSYTAGADFDFRFTIDKAKDWSDEKGSENPVYVVGAECRARKSPPKVGVRFTGQIFQAEDGLTTELKTSRSRGQLTDSEKIARNKKEADDFRAAALELANAHGPKDPIATEVFKVALKDRLPIGEKKRDEYFNALIAEGAIVKQPELRRDTKTGAAVTKARRNGGRVFVMSVEAAKEYRATFEGLAI